MSERDDASGRETNRDRLPEEFAAWYRSAAPERDARAASMARITSAFGASRQHALTSAVPFAERHHAYRPLAWFGAAAVAAALVMLVPVLKRDRMRDATVASSGQSSEGTRDNRAGRSARAQQTVAFQLQLTDGIARRVSLAGDFNGWNPAALPMLRDASTGVWQIRIALPPGRHSYSYVVDGSRWVIDPLAPRTIEGELGPTNVITVAGES